jgi:UDP-3-O-[3-hydroxymyristoyl] N-acetylglucosamine deacetylase/3-hydroxyacyl-[acyl-carrier-protein] dehydratase
MNTQQTTIKQSISLQGIGLHTGQKVTMTFHPEEPNKGITFLLNKNGEKTAIPALASFVDSTERGTTLRKDSVKIHTTEHVLAAIIGLEIDNLTIEIDAEEPPIMDGSSKFFVEALESAGIETQDAEKNYFEVKEIIRYSNEAEDVELMVLPYDGYKVTVMVDFGTKVLGTQNAEIKELSQFKKEIASSRTFSFLHELEYLLDQQLIKGGDLNNAIVYVDKQPKPETLDKLKGVFKKEKVSIKPNGILDNLDLHFPNEAARHKLLDVIGDLALAGRYIKGHVIAKKPGHKANTEFAKLILKHIRDTKEEIPAYDPNQTPVMDVVDIMNTLPHRPPFLLVDKIIELSQTHVVGVKSVTMNEPFFTGHFPGAPVMPGVLQIEAMAQVGGILALSTVPDPENYLTFFLKMNEVKFKHKVLPGDTLIFKLELLEPIRRGIVKMQGKAYVGNKLVSEAELMAQIVKEKNN